MMQRTYLGIFFIITFSLLFRSVTLGQGTSNEGTDFWVAYAGHVDDEGSRLTLFITSKVDATVKINLGGTPYMFSGSSSVSLTANQPKAIYINPNEYSNVYVDTYDGLEMHPGKGIHVTSDKPIVVYSHISRGARSAACLVYPTKALGHEYFAISYDQLADAGLGEIRASQFTVVGIEDDTEIEIIPSQDSRWLPVRKAGEAFTITLDKGDIYQFQSRTDITGSSLRTVNGCKPFAVFSGSSKTGYCEAGNTVSPNSPSGQDNLYQQLLPVSAWGRNFVTAPFYNTQNGNADIYRIQVANDNTTVRVNGSTTLAGGTSMSNPYAKGSVITFVSQSPQIINANNPINVTQFQTSQSCNSLNSQNPPQFPAVPGDPEMIILNPIEQTLKDITVYSAISTNEAPTNIRSHYINVIIKTADIPTFTIDGVTFSSNPASSPFAVNKFIKINDEYSYIIADVTVSSQTGSPSHRIRADGGFVAIAYGYGSVESYGYLAGSDLRNLNQFIQPENAITNLPITSGCDAEPLKLYVVLPYKTNSLKWDLGDGTGVKSDPNPDANYTTETINGVLSYKYRFFDDIITYNSPGIYKVNVMAVNPAPIGCDANETVTLNLTISAPPTANFSSITQACEGNSVAFTDMSVGNGLEIDKWYWDFGDGSPVEIRRNADPFTHVYAKAGDYEVTLFVEGLSGCQSAPTAPHLVHISELPKVKFSQVVCEEAKFTDQSDPVEGNIIKWSWNFGDEESGEDNISDQQHPTHVFSRSDQFTVQLTVETDKGCVNTVSSTVYAMPVIESLEDITILRGGEKLLSPVIVGKGLKYKWTPSAGLNNDSIPDPVAAPQEDTEYTLTVSAEGTCAVVDKVRVKVVEPEVPNAFSPNGDGINDRWAIKYLETYVNASVQIFNRYGQKVFTSGSDPWDGTYNGKEIPIGVYYYIIEPNNGRKRMVGSITLLR